MEGPVGRGHLWLAAMAYFPFLNLLPLAARPKPRFLLFHARQGLYLMSLFFLVAAIFTGGFYLVHFVFQVRYMENVLAVLAVMSVVAYGLIVPLMIISVFMRRMVMLPVLGEMAGER